MAIHFFSEDTDFSLIHKNAVKAWLKKVIVLHNHVVGNLNIIFCSDDYILNINRQYLSHDYYTDIITFNYNEDRLISGDIFISVDTVKSNSHSFNVIFSEELYRVIIHGVLHLIGFDDTTDSLRLEMREQETLSMGYISFLEK